MSCSRSSLVALVLLLVVAACGELPRPFQPGSRDGGVDLLVRLQDSRGVTVAPVYDAPPTVSAPLAERMAEAFRKQDIPATAKGVLANGYLLEGWARLTNGTADRADLAIDWRLTDRPGTEVARAETRRRIRLSEWTDGAPPLLDGISNEAAPGLVKALIGDSAAPAAAPARTVAIEVTGAPGDGNDALRRAFGSVLRRDGLPPADPPSSATVRLSGKVEVTPASDIQDQVRLVWTLRDEKDREIAVMTQENVVPKDRLSSRWGAMAFDIALAMRADIVDAVRRLDNPASTRLAVPPGLR